VLVSIEWDHFDRWRGFFASWPQFGVPAGLLLASGMISITNHAMSSESFSAWGWRIPFLASVVLIGVGLYVRLGLLETPAFARLRDQNQIAKMPVFEVLRQNWREVILTCLIRSAETGPFYIFTTFILTYGTRTLGLERAALLNFVTIASVVALFDIPLWGYVSDRIGRKRMYLIGAIALFLFAFPYYALLDTRTPALAAVAIVVSIVIHDMMYGPQAAFIAESFPTRLRYSGASLGYQLAAIVSGGPAPVIASYLMHRYGNSAAISVYLMVLGAVTIAATIMLKERSGASEEQAVGVEVATASTSPVSS
jgi:MFS family permease